jgi:hypothetical protein
MKRILLAMTALAVLWFALPARAGQTEVDRTLVTFGGHAITTGDVRRARHLKLINVGDIEAVILTALENRRLMLLEIGRIQQAPPTDAEKAARRREWLASLGSPADLPAKLAQVGMSEAMLDAWVADDVRISKYLEQRFSGAPNPDAATQRWIQDLRRRAGLPIGR